MNEELNSLKREIEELKAWKTSLESASSIPLNIDQSLRSRLSSTLGLSVSTKGASTEDVTVTEAGAATYAVMNDPDGFLQVTINGTVYYVPYFT